jgi:hypothetical protein
MNANKQRRVEPDWQGHPASFNFISRLLDEMLGIIISLLPTKSGSWTSVLSRCHLWRSVPLNICVDHTLCSQQHKLITLVSKILAIHQGPGRCFYISLFNKASKVKNKFKEWFQSSALDGLQELKFHGGRPPRSLPLSVLCFMPTLCVTAFFSTISPK